MRTRPSRSLLAAAVVLCAPASRAAPVPIAVVQTARGDVAHILMRTGDPMPSLGTNGVFGVYTGRPRLLVTAGREVLFSSAQASDPTLWRTAGDQLLAVHESGTGIFDYSLFVTAADSDAYLYTIENGQRRLLHSTIDAEGTSVAQTWVDGAFDCPTVNPGRGSSTLDIHPASATALGTTECSAHSWALPDGGFDDRYRPNDPFDAIVEGGIVAPPGPSDVLNRPGGALVRLGAGCGDPDVCGTDSGSGWIEYETGALVFAEGEDNGARGFPPEITFLQPVAVGDGGEVLATAPDGLFLWDGAQSAARLRVGAQAGGATLGSLRPAPLDVAEVGGGCIVAGAATSLGNAVVRACADAAELILAPGDTVDIDGAAGTLTELTSLGVGPDGAIAVTGRVEGIEAFDVDVALVIINDEIDVVATGLDDLDGFDLTADFYFAPRPFHDVGQRRRVVLMTGVNALQAAILDVQLAPVGLSATFALDAPRLVGPGTPFDLTLSTTNDGAVPIEGTSATLDFTGLRLFGDPPADCVEDDDGGVSCDNIIGANPIAPGAAEVITMRVVPTAESFSVSGTATAVAGAQEVSDDVALERALSDDPADLADVSVAIEFDPRGDEVVVLIRVRNEGPARAEGLFVSVEGLRDSSRQGADLERLDCQGLDNDSVCQALFREGLGPGEVLDFTSTRSTLSRAARVTATATAGNPDPDPDNNRASRERGPTGGCFSATPAAPFVALLLFLRALRRRPGIRAR